MSLCAILIGIRTPNIVIKTIHHGIVLDASELKNSLPEEYLNLMFPNGSGIDFCFFDRSRIIIRPQKYMIAQLDDEQMQAGQDYPLMLNDKKKLSIGDAQFHIKVFRSDF